MITIIVGVVYPDRVESTINFFIYHNPGTVVLMFFVVIEIATVLITHSLTEKQETKRLLRNIDNETLKTILNKDYEIKCLKQQLYEKDVLLKQSAEVIEKQNGIIYAVYGAVGVKKDEQKL